MIWGDCVRLVTSIYVVEFCYMFDFDCLAFFFFFSSRRRHTRCALVTGVQTCALPICGSDVSGHFQAGFDVTWELDLFGANRRRLEAARYGMDAAEIGRASCRERVCQYV